MAGHNGAQHRLTISGYDLGRFHVLDIAGECDMSTEADLRTALDEAPTAESGALILDLSRLAFCDGACAAIILAAGQGTDLVVTGAAGVTARVFDVLDPTETVPRHHSVDTAAWSLSELPEPLS